MSEDLDYIIMEIRNMLDGSRVSSIEGCGRMQHPIGIDSNEEDPIYNEFVSDVEMYVNYAHYLPTKFKSYYKVRHRVPMMRTHMTCCMNIFMWLKKYCNHI